MCVCVLVGMWVWVWCVWMSVGGHVGVGGHVSAFESCHLNNLYIKGFVSA